MSAGYANRRRYTLRDAWRDVVPLILMGLICWLVFVENPRLDEVDTRLDSALLGGCGRLQAERERINVLEATVYLTLKQASTTSDPRARPTYDDLANATQYNPKADCEAAVADPRNYRSPEGMRFDRLSEDFPKQLVISSLDGREQPEP
jgi:hypothetical protein